MTTTSPYLHQQALRFITDLNRQHACFQGIDWNADQESLIPAVAAACRQAIIPVPVNAMPETLSPRIARPGETIPELLQRCLDGHWRSVGVEFYFPDGLDYCSSPDPSLNTHGVAFGEWTWQINRHHEWLFAAQYFSACGDESAARAVSQWLRRWLEQCPQPDADHNARQGPWRTIEIGIRMGSVWPQILSAFYQHPTFDDTLLLAWLQSYAEQAAFVYTYRKHNNWLLMEMNGLVHAGVQVPMHRNSELWRNQAQDILRQETTIQFHDDGIQRELSASYHGVCFTNYMRAVQILQHGGHAVHPQLEQCIRKMLRPCRALARPNGFLFDFQDSHALNYASMLKQVPSAWHEPGDAWFLSPENNTPPPCCHVLHNAGYVVLRSGYNNDDLCVAFDGGPFGDAHQHEDKLSLQIHACGQDLIGEAGIVDYNDSPERHYSLSSLAHSTAIVDGLGQNRRATYADNRTALDVVATLKYDFDNAQPWAEAVYDEGYGPEQKALIIHQRRVILLSKQQIRIIDTFNSRDQEPHHIDILFHSMQDKAQLSETAFITQGPGANARICWTSDEVDIAASMQCGGTEPDLRGWAAPDDYSNGLYAVVPRPCLSLSFKIQQQAQVTTDVFILADGE